jgi:hypothetical protein
LRDIIDIEFTEFYDVGDKVCLANGSKFGVVVETYEISEDNKIIGGELIICWDTNVECDYEICSGGKENFLFKIDPEYEFTYINDDGTFKN